MLYEIYFSPTGGTKKVSDIIGQAWNCKKEEIDLCDASIDFSKYMFTENDICIVSIPSFGGRVPEVALSRIALMNGGNAKTILIAVFGNRAYDDTLLELKSTVISSNFSCIAAIAANAEHSIMHKFGAGRPDAQDKAELLTFAKKIKNLLEENTLNTEVNVPGNMPYKDYHGVPFKPTAGRKCIKCGLCAAKCPVNAIPKDNPVTVDSSKCISCMRCVSVCPNNSRKINRFMLLAASFKMKKVCASRKRNELFIQ